MSSVISIRVPRKLKEKMREYPIDWSKEIRGFIEERIKVLELKEIIEDIERKAEKRRTRTDSTKLIRETREEH